ncbi:MAG: class I SAM-dependent methyltransferase [Chlamydiota bacterium]
MEESLYRERKTCRACGDELKDVLDLGELPISSFLDPGDPPIRKYPVRLALSQTSGLVQLRHTVNSDQMYLKYWYMSGVNQLMKESLRLIVQQGLDRLGGNIGRGSVVVDIGANDGTLLSFYPDYVTRVGIDPAKNIKPVCCDCHINDYFSADNYKKVFGGEKAKLITSIAMFYDLEDPIGFCRDLADILSHRGLWIMEVSYIGTMLSRCAFDTICAEHLEYYSLRSIEYILDKVGLKVEDAELNDVNGGSFRLYIRHAAQAQETEAVKNLREQEQAMQFDNPETYKKFARKIAENKQEMVTFLKTQKREGKLVLGYGASTKGNTLMAYYGIDTSLMPFIADRNPIKWGKETVTGIPIVSEDQARAMSPDYFVAFPYHFIAEFLEREKAFLSSGGQFVSPVPCLKLFRGSCDNYFDDET